MVTIKDVAAEAGVSISTVSSILNDRFRVKEETYIRVMQAIEKLGYQPNTLARSLRTRETKTIGLVISSLMNNTNAILAKGIEDCALQHGYQVLFCHSDRDLSRERKEIEALISKCVDAILITTLTLHHENIDLLKNCDIPVISNTYEPDYDFIDEVYNDFNGMMCEVMEYVISMGHRRIFLLNGHKDYYRCIERYKAYKYVLHKYNIPFDESFSCFCDFRRETAYETACKIFKSELRPTCIITTTEMALGVINAAYDYGLKIPDDISIIGWADSADVRPKLTVVDTNNYSIGFSMMECAIRRINQKDLPKQSIVIPASLILRDSVKRIV